MRIHLFIKVLLSIFLALPFCIANAQKQEVQTDNPGEAKRPEIAAPTMVDDAIALDEDATGKGPGVDKDIILVLDNSGSMKQNDPNFLTSQAVSEFINALDDYTRVAIIIFDQNVTLALPFTLVSSGSKASILEHLDLINYRGQFTDSPNAIERAIYELKNSVREDARKIIVFLTDGIVDTGDAAADEEKGRWLKNSLAPDAADAGISIFAIAFTEAADFQLIQSLAQTTGGEYYRAIQAEEVRRVFAQINTIINEIEKKAEPAPQASQPPPPVQQPIVITVPAQPSPTAGREEKLRTWSTIAAGVTAILALMIILWVLLRTRRGGGAQPVVVDTEAYLQDIHGYTSQASYKMSGKPTMLGRVAGKDNDQLDYIVIPETTIGRRHSLIEYKDFAYWIVDQGSINGTFVNDVPVTSEVRLKHGDKIRLHRYEFEFVMPEMVDAGMTVMSNTVMAGKPAPVKRPTEAEVTKMKSAAPVADSVVGKTGAELDLDIDLTGGSTGQTDTAGIEDEEITALRGSVQEPSKKPVYDTEDVTYIPGGDKGVKPTSSKPVLPTEDDLGTEDETLMPGDMEFPEDEATIRKDVDDMSLDNFIDLDDLKGKKK